MSFLFLLFLGRRGVVGPFSSGQVRIGRILGRPILGEATIPENSIAVLPFENLSKDPDNVFFTEGIQDEILTDLAKVSGLKVISRTSVRSTERPEP